MPRKGYTWTEEYKEKFYSSPKVKSHLEKFSEAAKLPKTEDQKAKMSEAKKGRKYSDEHKARMAETHKFRNELRRKFEEANPDLDKESIWGLVNKDIHDSAETNNQ